MVLFIFVQQKNFEGRSDIFDFIQHLLNWIYLKKIVQNLINELVKN